MSFITFLASDPQLRLLQFILLSVAAASVYLVLYTTRDSILRSESFWFQFFSIGLVAVLPIVGFLLYLLLRPSRTLKEREMEDVLQHILETVRRGKKGQKLAAPEEGTDE
jgi:hypothetical protein